MNLRFDNADKTWLEENLGSLLEPADVFLVCMPYCDIELPSLALGLLQSLLYKAGINVKSIYANLLFCEQIGFTLYNRQIARETVEQPITDWSFSSSAFPDYYPDEDYFITQTHNRIKIMKNQSLEDFREELHFVREQAEKFTTNLAQQILNLSPRIIGCTASLYQRVPSLALLRKIRQLNPDVVTLMGGAECETGMGFATLQHFPWVDYVVSGEAEDLLVPLVNLIFQHGRRVPVESLPEGVFAPIHREAGHQNTDVKNSRAVAGSFNRQTTPSYQDYFNTLNSLPHLNGIIQPILPIQSSRGCWYGRCRWCGLNTPHIPYRSRPAAGILAEMDELYSTCSIERFQFLDNVLDLGYFEDFFPELIQRQNHFKLFFEIRAGLSKKQIEMLRAAGVVSSLVGIESLHTEALKTMQKGVKAWQNIETLKWCRQFGIRVYWTILYDFPGDQDTWYQSMAELVPLLIHLHPPGEINLVQFQRNSHYFDCAQDYSLNLKPYPLESYIYPLSQEAIKELSTTLQDEFYSSRRDTNSAIAALFPRPGFRSIIKAVNEWKEAFNSPKKPMLSMKIEDEAVIVSDTRPAAAAPSFRLTGTEKDLYLACIQSKKETQIREEYEDKGYCSSDVNNAIQALLDNKLMLRIDKRLLSLAVEEPYVDYLKYFLGN